MLRIFLIILILLRVVIVRNFVLRMVILFPLISRICRKMVIRVRRLMVMRVKVFLSGTLSGVIVLPRSFLILSITSRLLRARIRTIRILWVVRLR